MRKLSHKEIFRWLVFALSVVFFAVFVVGIGSNQHGSFFNKKHNAIWIEHDWVGKKKSEKEIQNLVEDFKKWQIDTVFVHSGPIREKGLIDAETYGFSPYFLETARKFDKNIKYQAWLGQIRNKLDLADEKVRHNVVNQTVIMAGLVGFDGIHLDIEPVWDGDEDFIKLLAEVREKLPEKKISVAISEFIPESFISMVKDWHKFENYNSQVSFKNVAEYADQIVVMVYDTGIKEEWLYKWLIKEQTIWVTNLLSDKEVFIAIPAYKKSAVDFNPDIENVENGLKGIVDGLNNLRSNERSFAGVAIYPYWELEDEDFEAYKSLWYNTNE